MLPGVMLFIFLVAELVALAGQGAGYLLNLVKATRFVRRWLRARREKRKRPDLDYQDPALSWSAGAGPALEDHCRRR